MDNHVNRGNAGWTELRVHGVSGTPPEAMLGHPHVHRVSGDAEAGFYRRWWESAAAAEDSDQRRLEAYSWSGLTAGSGQRALWLLLTPFMLINLAFWAMPYPPRTVLDQDRRGGILRMVADAVQRLFGLTLTLWFVAAVVVVSMDFVGWQCARPGAACADRIGWLSFLGWAWLDTPGRRLAITAVVPVVLVLVLWWLANKTWEMETVGAKMPAARSTLKQTTPLENRRVWNGSLPVRRLRSVHITAAFALIALLLLIPFAGPQWPGRWTALDGEATAVRFLATCSVVLLVVSIVLTLWRKLTDRPTPGADKGYLDEEPPRHDLFSLLPRVALAVVLLAMLTLTVASGGPVAGDRQASLPWVAETVQALAAAQVCLFAAVVLVLGILWAAKERRAQRAAHRQAKRAAAEGGPAPSVDDYPPLPAWQGTAAAVFLLLGSALAGAFAAGLALTVAHALGTPLPAATRTDAFVVPALYFWAAALTVPVAVWAVLLSLIGWFLVRRATPRILKDRVGEAYPSVRLAELLADPSGARSPAVRRARAVAKAWARGGVSDVGQRLGTWFVGPLVVLLSASAVLYSIDRGIPHTHLRFAVNLGDLLVVAFVAGLLYVGRTAYRNPGFRRSVGVLWDVGTFWPRMTHPLAPPCYAERAIPDLVCRIEHYRRNGGRVVLSCHSQGAVLGAATVMQLTTEQSRDVAFLTYGSPLSRLYAPFFPSHFGGSALTRIGTFLTPPAAEDAPPAAREEAPDRTCWPWRNLYRPSDPIGGHTLRPYLAVEITDEQRSTNADVGDNRDVDRCLVDPIFARTDGDTSYPPILGHSGYLDDPDFPGAVDLVIRLRTEAKAAYR